MSVEVRVLSSAPTLVRSRCGNPCVDVAAKPMKGGLGRGMAGAILMSAAVLGADPVPIVQPGLPGAPARTLTAEEAVEVADTSYSPADVRFMQDMIPHHHQAVQMAGLAADRTNRSEVLDAAGRIDLAQRDEIEFMRTWLSERGERVPDPSDHAGMHTDHRMAGMATAEEMAELGASEGTDFDRLFLRLMIAHHEGAVTMVEELLVRPGSAYDPVLFEFTTDVTNDQDAEIERMHALLVTLSDDPRAGLEPGFQHAGQARMNLELVASLPRPAGFFDPANPADLPPDRPDGDEDGEDAPDGEADGHELPVADGAEVADGAGVADDDAAADVPSEDDGDGDGHWGRAPLLRFSNTDMAFRGDVLFAGSYHGFNVYRLAEDGIPVQLSSVVCPGGQGDVSVVDEGFAYWHSATFNNDGTKLVFTDEWGGGTRPRCRVFDPLDWGADAIYDIVDDRLEFRSHFKMPAPQTEEENCVAHNGSVVPVPGRDIFAQAWYQGGISVVDFTDSANPVEIAYFDRGPIDAEKSVVGGYWSAYWYADRIYATEIIRGLDVLALLPSEYLSENEIGAAALASQGDVFNPQQQRMFRWPAEPVVARAYLDQIKRRGSLSAAGADLEAVLDLTAAALGRGVTDDALATQLESLAATMRTGDGAEAGGAAAGYPGLADTLVGIANRLRQSH